MMMVKGANTIAIAPKVMAMRNNARQPKGLLDDSEDIITINSGGKDATRSNAKESSEEKSVNKPAWHINQDGQQDSSNDESIPNESPQISRKFRRERCKKRRAAMVSRKRAAVNQRQNNTDPTTMMDSSPTRITVQGKAAVVMTTITIAAMSLPSPPKAQSVATPVIQMNPRQKA